MNTTLDQLYRELMNGTVGFERLMNAQRKFEGKSTAGGFPFYNIKRVNKSSYLIEIAVSGYSMSDIEITLEKNSLVVSSNGRDDSAGDYIYHGFASRKFSREFLIADNVIVKHASLENGILSIALEEYIREEDKPRKIEISSSPVLTKQEPQLLNE